MTAALGVFEARRLAWHPAVLGGLAAAVVLFVHHDLSVVPLWWASDLYLGDALLLVGTGALLAAHLAASRDRRDDMADLYESFPTPRSTRTAGHLLGLLGPVTVSVVFVGAAVLWVGAMVPAGRPGPVILSAAAVLVAFLGCLGVAVGTISAKLWGGLLAAVIVGLAEADVTVASFNQPIKLGPRAEWLFPWHDLSLVLSSLPGPVAGIPPARGHLAELVGLAALAAVAALAAPLGPKSRRGANVTAGPPGRRPLAACALVALAAGAVTGWGAWTETRPLPVAQLARLASLVVEPAAYETCDKEGSVAYCAYPAFTSWERLWARSVEGVLGNLPRRPARALVVRQVDDDGFLFSLFSSGVTSVTTPVQVRPPGPGTTIERALSLPRARAVALLEGILDKFEPAPRGNEVFVDLSWGAGAGLGPSQLNLSLAVAYWAMGIPVFPVTVDQQVPTPGGGHTKVASQVTCLPVGQARAAVAVWLAATATPATEAAFLHETAPPPYVGSVPYGSGRSQVDVVGLGSSFSDTVEKPPVPYGPALLGAEMARLPVGKVREVLSAHWAKWSDWRTSESALARALGLPLPAAPVPSTPAVPATGRATITAVGAQPPSPVCH